MKYKREKIQKETIVAATSCHSPSFCDRKYVHTISQYSLCPSIDLTVLTDAKLFYHKLQKYLFLPFGLISRYITSQHNFFFFFRYWLKDCCVQFVITLCAVIFEKIKLSPRRLIFL